MQKSSSRNPAHAVNLKLSITSSICSSVGRSSGENAITDEE